MIYGHFIEHFHRQIYGGIYDPEIPSPTRTTADRRAGRHEAHQSAGAAVAGRLLRLLLPLEGRGGEKRTPFFDKAWRVEDPNTFGTDEYVNMCGSLAVSPISAQMREPEQRRR